MNGALSGITRRPDKVHTAADGDAAGIRCGAIVQHLCVVEDDRGWRTHEDAATCPCNATWRTGRHGVVLDRAVGDRRHTRAVVGVEDRDSTSFSFCQRVCGDIAIGHCQGIVARAAGVKIERASPAVGKRGVATIESVSNNQVRDADRRVGERIDVLIERKNFVHAGSQVRPALHDADWIAAAIHSPNDI